MCEPQQSIKWVERYIRGNALKSRTVPEDDIVEVAPGVPADAKIEIESIREVEEPRNSLVAGAVQCLGTVKHCSCIVFVRGAVLGPTGVIEPWSFEILVQQISRRLTRSDRQHKQISCAQ